VYLFLHDSCRFLSRRKHAVFFFSAFFPGGEKFPFHARIYFRTAISALSLLRRCRAPVAPPPRGAVPGPLRRRPPPPPQDFMETKNSYRQSSRRGGSTPYHLPPSRFGWGGRKPSPPPPCVPVNSCSAPSTPTPPPPPLPSGRAAAVVPRMYRIFHQRSLPGPSN